MPELEQIFVALLFRYLCLRLCLTVQSEMLDLIPWRLPILTGTVWRGSRVPKRRSPDVSLSSFCDVDLEKFGYPTQQGAPKGEEVVIFFPFSYLRLVSLPPS